MRKLTCLLLGMLLVAAAALPVMAGTRMRPTRYAALDRGLTNIADPHDGSSWAAWAYRNGAEYDIAVAFERGDGIWSEPTLIGLDDGRNQVEPSLTLDTRGTLYLVFTERETGRIMLSVRARDASSFSVPVALTPVGLQASGALVRVVGDRLVVAYRVGRTGLALADLSLVNGDGTITTDSGFTDGPDPVGGTGEEEEEGEDDDDDGSSSTGTGAYPMGGGSAPPRGR